MRELMANTTLEQMKASMGEWIEWRDKASTTVKVEFGMPLQAVSNVSPSGAGESHSNVSGYATLEGESQEAVVDALKSHPYLQGADASMDVLEVLSMPGL